MRFLVTGTGRCGTLYAARFLQNLGLDVRHEHMGVDGTSNWWLAVPWSLSPVPTFDKTLHIVREPLATISSLTTCSLDHEIWPHIIANSPVDENDPLLLRCMKHWFYWNLMAEAIADKTMRVEAFGLSVIQDFFGVQSTPTAWVPTDTHTWKGRYTPRSWQDCEAIDPDLTRLIRKLAARYGYDT